MPTPVATNSKKGKSGLCVVKPKGKSLFMTFVDENGKPEAKFTVTPTNKERFPKPEVLEGTFYAMLNEDNTDLLMLVPIDTVTFGKFVGFQRDQDGMIVVISVPARNGVTKDGRKWAIEAHDEIRFGFRLEEFGGLVIYHPMIYCFDKFEVDGREVMGLKGMGSKNMQKLLEAIGYDFEKDEVEWSDEFLEDLEHILLERGKNTEVKLVFDDRGRISSSSISRKTRYTIEVEEEEEPRQEEPSPKKAVKVDDLDEEVIKELLKKLGH